MLFGAMIERLPDDTYRLQLRRGKRRWSQLGWAIIVAESQDPGFPFLRFNIQTEVRDGAEFLTFRTPCSRFLGSAWERWYGCGEKRMPTDVVLDEKAKMFWLLGNWRPRNPTLPRWGRTKPPEGPGKWRISTHHAGVFELQDGASDVTKWLQDRIPERILDEVAE